MLTDDLAPLETVRPGDRDAGGNGVRRPRLKASSVVAEVDTLLDRSAAYYPQDLPIPHYAHIAGWERPLRPGAIPGGRSFRSPLGQQLDRCRQHAEALLVHERLGETKLDADERERLTTRALGILPDSMTEQFGEILACTELRPGSQAKSPRGLLTAAGTIEREIGHPAALAYAMLVLAGVESDEELLSYAQRIERLRERVTSAQPVIQTLHQASTFRVETARADRAEAGAEARFEVLLSVVRAVYDRLWRLKPERASTPFLLTQVLNAYLGTQRGVGNSLGLAIVDAIVLGQLGFEIHHRLDGDTFSLEVKVHHRTVLWSTARRAPLDPPPDDGGRRLSLDDLFALTCRSTASAYVRRGRIDRAIEQYRRELELTPDSIEAHNLLGNCFIRNNMPEDAVETAQRVLELEPESAEAHQLLGNSYAMMKRWPRAIRALKRAIQLRPESIEAYNNLGIAFHRSGAPEQAVAAFEAATKLRPDYAEAHFNCGNVHLEREQFDDAVRCFREAVRHHPEFAQAHYNLGQAWYRKGRLDPAIQSYRRAIEINPKHFGAWHNLGIAYRDKGLKQQAVEALERAVTLNPNLMR